ncbi:MAG: hypothetical protein AB7V00_01870 [Bacilli bacterium]
MKKIIVCIISLFAICFVKVNALETIVTIENTGTDELLTDENHQIIKNNVDWSEPGTYQVEYFNLENHLYEIQDVIISSIDTLHEGISYIHKEEIAIDFSAKGIKKIDNEKTLVFGGKNNGYYPYQSQNETLFAYVALYVNGQIIWEKTINDLYYGLIRDAVITNRGIVLIGDYDTMNQGRNVFIHEYSLSGVLLDKIEFQGEGDDFAHRIFFENNALYFISSSQSVSLDYQNINCSGNNIIVGLLSFPNSQFSIIALGNEGKNVFFDALFLDSQFYLLMEFQGDGYFISGTNETDYLGIIAINCRLDVIEWISLSPYNLGNVKKILAFNDKIGLASVFYETSRMQIFYFSQILEYLYNETIIICDGNYQIRDYHVWAEQEKIIVMTKADNSLSQQWFLYLYDASRELINFEKFACENNLEKCVNLTIDEDQNIFFGSTINNEKVILTEFTLLKTEDVTIGSNICLSTQQQLLINGFIINGNLFKNSVDPNPYGLYTNLYQFKTNQFNIILPFFFDFSFHSNIRHLETYDIGTIVNFNGTGFLNGEEINTGHIIEASGNYYLEIIGNNNEQKSIIFSIESLSEQNTSLVQDIAKPEATIAESLVFSDNEEHFIQLITKEEVKSTISMEVYGAIMGALLGIMLGLFLSFKKVFRKKHV